MGALLARKELITSAVLAAAPAIRAEAAAAERERLAKLVDGYRCPCGEEDCPATDVVADIAGLICEEAPGA